MGLLEDVGSLLTAASVATTSAGSTGWRLVYREFQPSPSPVRQVCVRLTGGLQSEERAPITRPSFQVAVRGSTGQNATLETKVQAVISALNFQEGTINSWTYVDMRMEGDALYLGRDEHQQPQYSINFQTVRSRTS